MVRTHLPTVDLSTYLVNNHNFKTNNIFTCRLHYSSSDLPKTKHEWEGCIFIDKTHWGYYTWPK